MSQANEPAFRSVHMEDNGYGMMFPVATEGLTKREYFAGQAVAGMADRGLTPEYVAHHAVQYADALIAELERTNA